MSLTVSQVSALMSILSEDTINNQPLEYIVSQLHQHFKQEDNFKVGLTLLTIIQHSDFLLNQSQKFVAIILCYELYRNEPIETNPLAPIFMHLLHKNVGQSEYVSDIPSLTTPIKVYLYNLLTSKNPKELLQKTAEQVLTCRINPNKSNVEVSAKIIIDAMKNRRRDLPHTAKCSLPVIICDPQKPHNETEEDPKQVLEQLVSRSESYTARSFKPEMMRLVPPLYVCKNEMAWLNLNSRSIHRILYDKTMCIPVSITSEMRELMTKALKAPLSLQKQHQLITHLEKDPKLVDDINIAPNKLPDLIDNNPLMAVQVLLKLMSTPQITDYFSILVNMDMSLHSMEVVNRLTNAVELPTEFIRLYISNCITTCETIRSEYMKNRLVRLVCVFLQSLIRNKILNIQDMFYEVQSFCSSYIEIREASALYRLLKQIETGDNYSGNDTDNVAHIQSIL